MTSKIFDSILRSLCLRYPQKCYRYFGFALVPSLMQNSEIIDIRTRIESYFTHHSLPSEKENCRIHPFNIVDYFGDLLNIQLQPQFLNCLLTLYPQKTAIEQSLQIYRNVDYAGWHIDAGSQLRHKEYNLKLSRHYQLAKFGVCLNDPNYIITPTISIIPCSHYLPPFMHSLVHIFLKKFSFINYILNLISLSLDGLIKPGEGIVFSHLLWHRSSHLSRRKYPQTKCMFYFEIGALPTITSHLIHNAIRSMYIEDYLSDTDVFWCSYLSTEFINKTAIHSKALNRYSVLVPTINSPTITQYLDAVHRTKHNPTIPSETP
jgi:hypothetical protein